MNLSCYGSPRFPVSAVEGGTICAYCGKASSRAPNGCWTGHNTSSSVLGFLLCFHKRSCLVGWQVRFVLGANWRRLYAEWLITYHSRVIVQHSGFQRLDLQLLWQYRDHSRLARWYPKTHTAHRWREFSMRTSRVGVCSLLLQNLIFLLRRSPMYSPLKYGVPPCISTCNSLFILVGHGRSQKHRQIVNWALNHDIPRWTSQSLWSMR